MLFRRDTLERIARGEVTLAFRRWHKPPPKNGSTLKTAIGVLRLAQVERVEPHAISEADAQQAGFASRAALLHSLPEEGSLFRVALERIGPDPRVALRDARLRGADASELAARLAALDQRAPEPWTRRLLELVSEHPAMVSTRLAKLAHLERVAFKRRMRQLKELGLTESLEVGYRLSPRGHDLLAHLRR
jgi:hypothetical protein